MRNLSVVAAFVALNCFSHVAAADDADSVSAEAETSSPGPSNMEAGVFAGGFISNYYNQFYDAAKFPMLGTRPLINQVDPQFGARYAYFPHPYFGLEGEGTIITAGLQGIERLQRRSTGSRSRRCSSTPLASRRSSALASVSRTRARCARQRHRLADPHRRRHPVLRDAPRSRCAPTCASCAARRSSRCTRPTPATASSASGCRGARRGRRR